MQSFLMLLLLATSGAFDPPEYLQCDMIEINSIYYFKQQSHGMNETRWHLKRSLRQVIMYDRVKIDGVMHLKIWHWFILRDPHPQIMRDELHNECILRVSGVEIRSPVLIHTSTEIDPERENRKMFPEDERRPVPEWFTHRYSRSLN